VILLDTCTIIWLTQPGQPRLSAAARQIVAANAGGLFFSSISAFEVAVKARRRKLMLPQPPSAWFPAIVARHGLLEIPADVNVLLAAAALPMHHSDPFDRIIVATAAHHSLGVLTPDEHIAGYEQSRAVW
jgi:PIN domain nuclease of toxin-antitoxin system